MRERERSHARISGARLAGGMAALRLGCKRLGSVSLARRREEAPGKPASGPAGSLGPACLLSADKDDRDSGAAETELI